MTDILPKVSKAHRGFAAMSPEQRSAIARAGGQAAQAAGTGHHWTPTTAAIAGRTGGLRSSADRDRMRELGRKGGLARGANARKRVKDERND